MRLFDTHCHLDAEGNAQSADEIIARAKAVGVERIVLPAVEPANWERCAQIAQAHEGVYLALGIHPQAVNALTDEEIDQALEQLPALLKLHGAVAVGEAGLDFRWDKDEHQRQRQLRVCHKQLEIGHQLGLPVILHCLDAQAVLLEQWRAAKMGDVMGIMHSYSGSAEMVRDYERAGMWISYSGSVTWSNAKRTPNAAKATSDERLLIETDAPYQPPHPLAEPYEPNHPARLTEIAQVVAKLRAQPLQEVAQRCWENACTAFGIT